MNEIIKHAKLYSTNAHFQVNHKYDGMEYFFHINEVYKVALKFKHLINQDILYYVLASAYTHDLIEDTRKTYNNVKDEFGVIIAEITFAVSNEKGKTRSERANDKYYNEMKLVDGAVFIKLCDRIANLEYSKTTGSTMFEKYKKEYSHFKDMLFDVKYQEMFNYIENILYK